MLSPRLVFRAALFDYNGVLVDDEHVHLAAFRDTLAPLGLELHESDYWERYLGFDDQGAFSAILQDAGRPAPDDVVRGLIEAKRPLYLARAKQELRAFDGAADLVRRMHRAGPIAVVSGALRDEIELGLGALGVRDLVSYVVSAEDTRASKPDPEGYLLASRWLIEQTGQTGTTDVLVVEDSLSGIGAAKLAKLSCLAVAHSYPRSELLAAGADEAVAHIADVTDAVLEDLYRRIHAA
jgi:beta-phosphoglucomutase